MSISGGILPSSLLSSFGSSLVRFLFFFGFFSSSSSTAQREAYYKTTCLETYLKDVNEGKFRNTH